MSAERDELHRLVDELPEADVPQALQDIRLRGSRSGGTRPWPPPWFGAAAGSRSDTAARREELLEGGFGRSA